MTNVNSSQLPSLMRFDPGGTSVNNMLHWAQLVKSGKFCMRDWGAELNPIIYNRSIIPPSYNLSLYNGPKIVMFSGAADDLVDPVDVTQLVSLLPSEFLLEHHVVPTYGHMDFVWGMDAADDVYSVVLAYLGLFFHNPLFHNPLFLSSAMSFFFHSSLRRFFVVVVVPLCAWKLFFCWPRLVSAFS